MKALDDEAIDDEQGKMFREALDIGSQDPSAVER
jgi:hypothetical protein